MRKILYVEDMEKCYLNTKETIGDSFEIDWRKNYSEGKEAILENVNDYSVAIFDVNLDFNSNLPLRKQTKEGLDLIKLLREKSKKQKFIPILCVSSNGKYRESAIKNGADLFLFKKEFWENGNKILEELIKKV